MPLYVYICSQCGNEQEELHPMSGPDYEIRCNKCESAEVEKKVSCGYVKFVGSDWDTNQQRGIS